MYLHCAINDKVKAKNSESAPLYGLAYRGSEFNPGKIKSSVAELISAYTDS